MKNKKIPLLLLGLLSTILLFILSFLIIVNIKEDPSTIRPTDQNGPVNNDTHSKDKLNDVDQELKYLQSVLTDKDEQQWQEELEEIRELDLAKEGDKTFLEHYTSLEQLENYLKIKHTLNVRQHPELVYYDQMVTFNLNTNFIQYGENSIHTEPLIVENDTILIPNRFITEYYGINIIETKTGNKLTAFNTIPILLYHTVNEGNNSTLNTQPGQFEEHIKTLVFNGYTGVSPSELYDFYYGEGTLPEKPLFINFDDGAKDVYTGAYPVLQKYGVKATFFIIASKIEHEGLNSYPNEIAKISWEDAHAMSDLVTIQNHTWNSHRKIVNEKGKEIGQIAAPQLKDNGEYESLEEYINRITLDISQSQNIILEKMGYPSIIFSFPYGEYSKEAISVANKLGSAFAVSVNQGRPLHVDSLMVINRMVVNGNWSGEQLLEKVNEKLNQ